jgi:hypothetical protein
VGERGGGGVDGLFLIKWREGCWSMCRAYRFGRGSGKVSKLGSRSGVAVCNVGAGLPDLVEKP